MKNNTLIQSYFSTTNDERSLFINAICYTLSCLYAKKNGFKLILHTDERGAKLLDHCPYEKIVVDLKPEDFPLSGTLYAAPKLKTLEKYPLGTIHIDGDVFLKRPSLINELDFSTHDAIVQSVERPPLYGWGWAGSASALKNCTYPEWAQRECKAMFNNGILGFNNQELKDEYLRTYWDMYEQFKTKGIHFGVPDIIIEQQFLLELCKTRGYDVKCLIDGDRPSESANKIGYQHLIGCSKSKEYMQILDKIYELDPKAYLALKQKFYHNIKFCWKHGTLK